jgi:large subunit ribosomal protein L25
MDDSDAGTPESVLEAHIVTASARASTGKGAARKSRATGSTPGVLYRAGEEARPLNFNVAELAGVYRKTGDPNTLLTVKLDGVDRLCLIREIQRHPVSRVVEHIDFYEVSPDYVVQVDVAVNPVGRAAGTRAGGLLRVIKRTLSVKAPAGAIPRLLDVDVTNLEVGQFIRASDIVPPAGVAVVFKRDFNVLTVEGKRTERGEAAAAAPAGGKPAAAAAKPAAAKPAPKK